MREARLLPLGDAVGSRVAAALAFCAIAAAAREAGAAVVAHMAVVVTMDWCERRETTRRDLKDLQTEHFILEQYF